MIHGGSNHPTLIKKIDLRIWRLRDEVEAIIKSRLAKCEDPNNPPSIQDLIEEYAPTVDPVSGLKHGSEGLQVVDGGKDDQAEDSNDKAGEEETQESDQEASAEQAENMVNEQTQEEVKEVSTIYQRRPKLPKEKIYHGQAVLSEINMDTLYFFSNERFLSGQSIVIEFLVPKRFIVNADIVFCRTFNMRSRIISENRHPYRVAAQFSFLRQGERTLLRNFISSIEPEVSTESTPLKPTGEIQASGKNNSGDEGDDDLSELDDFDI